MEALHLAVVDVERELGAVVAVRPVGVRAAEREAVPRVPVSADPDVAGRRVGRACRPLRTCQALGAGSACGTLKAGRAGVAFRAWEPAAPWAPVAPVSPLSPFGPWAPVAPVSPFAPCRRRLHRSRPSRRCVGRRCPVAPFALRAGPAAPCGPIGPESPFGPAPPLTGTPKRRFSLALHFMPIPIERTMPARGTVTVCPKMFFTFSGETDGLPDAERAGQPAALILRRCPCNPDRGQKSGKDEHDQLTHVFSNSLLATSHPRRRMVRVRRVGTHRAKGATAERRSEVQPLR